MLEREGYANCRFEAVDISEDATVPGAPFDLVFARLLLLHVDDRPAVLRRLWDMVAPGGALVVQDYDLLSAEVVPEPGVIADFKNVALESFRRTGRDLHLGLRLAALHDEAGIGTPDGIDAGVRVGLLEDLAPLYEGVYRATLPIALELELTTSEAGERWFSEFASYVAERGRLHTAFWPPLVGTWKRKP
jgi:SAM-dependent methyltransferase